MPATFDGPAPSDHSEVGHVVGYQCPLLLITDGKKGLVVLGLPASLDSRDDIEAPFSKLCGDRRRVVMVESSFTPGRAAGELSVVLHSRPDEPRGDAEVGGCLIDVAAICAQCGHDLVNVEPGADDERLATPSRPSAEPDHRVALE